MDHPLGTAFPISGLIVDSSLKILPLVNNAGTFQVFKLGSATAVASGAVTVGTNGRAIGPAYNPNLQATTYPYTAAGVTYTAAPALGEYYEVVIFGTAVLGLAAIACPAGKFRFVPAEDTPGVPKVQVHAFTANLVIPNSAGTTTLLERVTAKIEFPSNFTKLLIGTNGKVTPVDVTVCGYANGMAPATMAEVMTQVKEARTLPLSFRNDGGQPVVDLTIATNTWGVTVNVPVFMDTVSTSTATSAAKAEG